MLFLALKKVGKLTDGELSQVCQMLTGSPSGRLLDVLHLLREREPDCVASRVLASPTAQQLFAEALKSARVAA